MCSFCRRGLYPLGHFLPSGPSKSMAAGPDPTAASIRTCAVVRTGWKVATPGTMHYSESGAVTAADDVSVPVAPAAAVDSFNFWLMPEVGSPGTKLPHA